MACKLTIEQFDMFIATTEKFGITIRIKDGAPINITDFVVKMIVADDFPEGEVDPDRVIFTKTAFLSDPTVGKAEFHIVPEDTEEMDVEEDYFYQYQYTEPNGDFTVIGVGKFKLKNQLE